MNYFQADPYSVSAGVATPDKSSTNTHKIWTQKTTFSLDGMVDDINKLKKARNENEEEISLFVLPLSPENLIC